MGYFPQDSKWLAIARELKPTLCMIDVVPRNTCTVEPSADAFAGWKTTPAGPVSDIESRAWKKGESFTLDFGDHHVGHLFFDWSVEGEMDAPTRIRLVFAELPLELAEPFDPYTGALARTWLQDETLTVDLLPDGGEYASVALPRRYAFRYVRVEIVAATASLRFRNFRCQGITSADESKVPAVALPSPWKEIDEISRRTLRNCMLEVFEDGPKRDRRLWMGDLRLQAMANAVTFQNFDLVKRCLYLFAALTAEDGLVNGCVYEYPKPHGSGANPLDYALLFGPTLLEYAHASGDVETARDLWPVALRQLDFAWRDVDEKGVWDNLAKRWIFIDWNPDLRKHACLSGVLAFSIRQIEELAKLLKHEPEMVVWRERLEKLIHGTRSAYWDDKRGLAVCEGQVSLLSQAWFILGGIISREEGANALRAATQLSEAARPISPYGYHMVIEAMLHTGLEAEASSLIRDFWGGMVKLGANTFWEVWNPADHRTTPYGNPLLNSACHAWSCTPTYFIRRWPQLVKL